MKVSDAMLDAAMKKAVEAGLVPRDAYREDTLGYQELVRYVVQAALDVQQKGGTAGGAGTATQPKTMTRAVKVRDAAHWFPGLGHF